MPGEWRMRALLARHLERVVDTGLLPGTRQGAIVRADVVELRVDHDRSAVAALRFDVHGPVARLEHGTGEPHDVRAGVDHAVDVLAVPLHDDDHRALASLRPPLAAPSAVERKSLLGLNGHGEQ